MINPDRKKSPAVSEFGALSISSPTEITLTNGVKLVVIDNGEQPVNMLAISWEGGFDDVVSPQSLKMMTATINEGSVSFDSEHIADILDFNGSWLRIGSSGHHTTLRIYSLNSRLAEVMPVVREIITSPLFPEEAIESKRRKLSASLKVELEKVSYVANVLSNKMILGNDNPGSRQETLEQYDIISKDDLVSLHKQIILGNTPTVYLAGKISDELVSVVKENLGNIDFGNDGCVVKLFPPAPDNEPCRKNRDMPGKLQSAIRIGCPAVGRFHPDYDQLRIAVTALGGYFGSRLSMNIREEKGYTYGISAGLLGTLDGSIVSIGCQCGNEFVEPVLHEVNNELRRLATEPMTKEELDAVRRYQMSMLASTLDNPINIADYYINMRTVGTPEDYFYRQQKALSTITPERIMELSDYYLSPEKMYVAVAGPISL